MEKEFVSIILLLLLGGSIIACENSVSEISFQESDKNLKIEKQYYQVFTNTKPLKRVQTSGLPLYQLGRLTNPVLGVMESHIISQLNRPPTIFGKYNQSAENSSSTDNKVETINEQEKVSRVVLRIPFFSGYKRNNSGVVSVDGDRNIYELDSIYGNKNASFSIKVQELTYYLRNLDPSKGFRKSQIYYSDQDLSANVGKVLFDGGYKIDNKELVTYKEDDSSTSNKDESKEVDTRESPRIQLELDKDFFQTMILDKEGSDELSTTEKFNFYFRGLYISAHSFSEDIWMLLDFNNANIKIEYTYKFVDTSNNNSIVDKKATLTLGAGNITFNYFKNSGKQPSSTNTNNPKPVFLAGGQGYYSEIKLFDNGSNSDNLDKLKKEPFLFNEASLTFHIDRTTMDALGNVKEPKRLYLFDLEDKSTPILDYINDITTGSTSGDNSYLFFGGILEKSRDKGTQYKMRVTSHLQNIVKRDSTNVRLGLAIVNDIRLPNTVVAEDMNGTQIRIPTQMVINPFSTVLYGGEATISEDKRLRLEIYKSTY